MGILWNLLLTPTCFECNVIGGMHVFHFKMYISAVFGLIAMNLTLYSPTVTWYMCAEFAAFTTFGTKGVNVLVFGQVVVTALDPKSLTVWVAV